MEKEIERRYYVHALKMIEARIKSFTALKVKYGKSKKIEYYEGELIYLIQNNFDSSSYLLQRIRMPFEMNVARAFHNTIAIIDFKVKKDSIGKIISICNKIKSKINEYLNTKMLYFNGRTDRNTIQDKKLMSWTGNKSEFAVMIIDKYNEETDNYKSKRDATYKIFPQYDLTHFKNWTVEKCYDLVRKAG